MTTQQYDNSDKQLAITAYGLHSAVGDRDFALFGAIASMINTSVEDDLQEVPSRIEENKFDPVLLSTIPEYEDLDPDLRMYFSLEKVLLTATDYLYEKELEDKKHLLLIVLPAAVYSRSDFIDKEYWKYKLENEFEHFSDLKIRFLNADEHVTKYLQSACIALTEDKVESIIFAGIDSLVDQQTCQDLIEEKRLCSTEITNGVIPGEAAACVVIQKIDIKIDKYRALIKGISHTDEPNAGNAHTRKMTGLTRTIRNVSEIAGNVPDDIECLIRNSTSEQQFAFEWYQTSQNLWSNKLSEQLRVSYQTGEIQEAPKLKPRKMPEELFTSISLGEIGAATIPLSLILGCARFEFNYPVVNNCLVSEVNEFPFRGAILLTNPNKKLHSKAKTTK